MKFNVNQQDLQQALSYCQGVIEKRSTLPILSNVLLNANNSKLTITATDLDLIFIHQINNIEVLTEGNTTTTSSNDVTNANKPPDMTPGNIKGKVIFIKVFTGSLPRLDAALVTLWSKPVRVAVTVITTKGVPKIIWANTIPVCVAANPTFAIKKKIATPDMIRGTIIGEIKVAIIKPL